MRAHTAWLLLHFGKAGAGLCQDQGIHVEPLSGVPTDRDADPPLWEKTGCGISQGQLRGKEEAGPAFLLDSSQMHSSLPSWVGDGRVPRGYLHPPPAPPPTFIQNSACTFGGFQGRCRMSRKIPLVKPLQVVQPPGSESSQTSWWLSQAHQPRTLGHS